MADANGRARAPVASPTEEIVQQLVKAYRYFNRELFGDSLPEPVITLNRRPHTEGYFSADRFIRMDETTTHEIGLNPATFATRSLMHVLGTLVREMVHISTHVAGKAARRWYHNKYWADVMESVGLIPTATGELGGKKTGGKLKHIIVKDGPFEKAAKVLIESGFEITWFDRYPVPLIENDQDNVMGAELMRKSKLDVDGDPDDASGEPDEVGTAVDPAGSGTTNEVAAPMGGWSPLDPTGDPPGTGTRGAALERPRSQASPGGASGPGGGAEAKPLLVIGSAASSGRHAQSSKNKFKCPQCEMQAWAKKTARLLCGEHQVAMQLVEPTKAPAFQSD